MRNFNLIFILILSLVSFQCEKDDSKPEEYLTATIDGIEFNAKWLKAKKYTDNDGRKWLEISSATVNLEQSNSNSDYETISFSLIDNCLNQGTYNYDFIQGESGMNTVFYPFLYLYNYYNFNEKRIYSYSDTSITVIVDEIEYEENGIIKGKFEFDAICITESVQIKNGNFQIKIEE